MSVTLQKEFREILPMTAGATLIVAVAGMLFERPTEFLIVAFPVVCALLAASLFGTEFQHRTMSLLLAQPHSRNQIWSDKMLVLVVGVGAFIIVISPFLAVFGVGNLDMADMVFYLVPVSTLCAAPLFTLAMRTGTGGAVLALGLPVGLCIVVYNEGEKYLTKPQTAILALVLLTIYCACTYWAGYKLFLRLELIEGEATPLDWPHWLRRKKASSPAAAPIVGKPIGALLGKEVRVLQPVLLVAAGFSCISALGIVGGGLGYESAELIVTLSSAIYMILTPLLAGALSTAEERAWGISEWHLTLPPRAFKQWLVKSIGVSGISLVTGLGLPLAVLAMFSHVSGKGSDGVPPADVLSALVILQLLVIRAAMLSGLFSSTTIKAVLLGAGLATAGVLSMAWSIQVMKSLLNAYAGPGSMQWGMLAWGLLLCLAIAEWFAYRDYRHPGLSLRRFASQVILLLIIVGLLGAILYSECGFTVFS